MEGGGYGVSGDVIVGLVGACVGGCVFSLLMQHPNPVNDLDPGSICVAVVGAPLLIAILRLVSGRGRPICAGPPPPGAHPDPRVRRRGGALGA